MTDIMDNKASKDVNNNKQIEAWKSALEPPEDDWSNWDTKRLLTLIDEAESPDDFKHLDTLIKSTPSFGNQIDQGLLCLLIELGYRSGRVYGKVARVFSDLLNYMSDINAQNEEGYTALMIAIDTRQPGLAENILGKKPDVNVENGEGKNALVFALEQDMLESVKLLLDAGANLNYTKNGVKTSIMALIEEMGTHHYPDDQVSKEIVDLIASHTEKKSLLGIVNNDMTDNNVTSLGLSL